MSSFKRYILDSAPATEKSATKRNPRRYNVCSTTNGVYSFCVQATISEMIGVIGADLRPRLTARIGMTTHMCDEKLHFARSPPRSTSNVSNRPRTILRHRPENEIKSPAAYDAQSGLIELSRFQN